MAVRYDYAFKQRPEVAPSKLPQKEDCIYTAHYCEENIWKLVTKIQENSPEDLPYCYVVFISNDNTYIPLWGQSSSKQEDGLVVWDYHVIMVYYNHVKSLVFDFDTRFNFPTTFSHYSKETFKSDDYLNPFCHRYFRVISADDYLGNFSSDRRHMKNEDGTWKMPPPTYPPIKNCEDIHNLPQYISMKESNACSKFGTIFNLKRFIDKFSCKKSLSVDYPPDPLQPSWLD